MRILKLKEVLTRTGLRKTTLYMLIRDRGFPQQIPLGLRAVGWLESEVDAWILEKIESRNRVTS
nr:AlpA family transcriptional regulator [Comamonas koreensis]